MVSSTLKIYYIVEKLDIVKVSILSIYCIICIWIRNCFRGLICCRFLSLLPKAPNKNTRPKKCFTILLLRPIVLCMHLISCPFYESGYLFQELYKTFICFVCILSMLVLQGRSSKMVTPKYWATKRLSSRASSNR